MKVKNRSPLDVHAKKNALIFFLIVSVERWRLNWCVLE